MEAERNTEDVIVGLTGLSVDSRTSNWITLFDSLPLFLSRAYPLEAIDLSQRKS